MNAKIAQPTRLVAVALLALACVLAPACSGVSGADEPEPAVKTEAELGPVAVAVWADATELRAADRLGVVVEVAWDTGSSVGPLEFHVERAGWTVVSRAEGTPERRADGRLASTTRFTLEPLLPGQYELPPASVSWSTPDGASGITQTEPLAVTVEPLLDESADLLALAADREPPPPPPAEARPPAWVFAAAGAAIVAVIATVVVGAWSLARRSPGEASPLRDRLRALEAALADPETPTGRICDAAAATMRAARSGANPETDALRRSLDEARFAPTPPDPKTARSLGSRALELTRASLSPGVAP